MSLLAYLRRHAFGVSVEQTKASRRGFHQHDPAIVRHLERVGAEFLAGYHAALETPVAVEVAARLNASIDLAFRGFAFEGAGMGFALLDHLRLSRNGFAALLRAADEHRYMVHVGAGWAWARLPWVRSRPDQARARLDPLIGWLAIDGYGFHEGYFHLSRTIRAQAVPAGVAGYDRRAFDQGVGRSLWFVEGADPERIAQTIDLFDADRRSDLWAGVGLAATYAGGVRGASLRDLVRLAGPHRSSVALGCAFACEARSHAGNMMPHTEHAANVFAGMSAAEAAAITRQELRAAVDDDSTPRYEMWRRLTQRRVSSAEAATPSSPRACEPSYVL
jgi:enediyne biosynthesis protein E3